VYRQRFGDLSATIEPNLRRAATLAWRPAPEPRAGSDNLFEE
jgi:hypothetical protein